MLFGPTPPDDGTHVAFTIVPPTDEPIAEGDTIPAGRPSFRSVTTFATVGITYQTGVAEDAPALATDGSTGSAEVLYLDSRWVCLRVRQHGPIIGVAPSADWSVSAVVAAPIVGRVDTSFT